MSVAPIGGINFDQIMEQFGGYEFSPEQVDAITNMMLVVSTVGQIKQIEMEGRKLGVDEAQIELDKQRIIFEQSEQLPFERDKLQFQRDMQELQMQQEQQQGEQRLAMGDQNLEQAKFGTLQQLNSYNNSLMGGALARESSAQSYGSDAQYRDGAARARFNPRGFSNKNPLGF